jgi:hypothetical protein
LRLFPKLTYSTRELSLGRLYQAAPHLSIGLPYIDLRTLIKKENKIFLINKEFGWDRVQSHMYEEGLPNILGKGTNIFTIYEEVVSHI